MFKPTLKRSKLDLNIQSRSLLNSTRTINRDVLPHNQQVFTKSPQTISLLPRKMLQENTDGFFIPKKSMVCPLSILSYKYPPQVSQLIEKNRQKRFHSGIGYYDNIFYIFINETLTLWHYMGKESFQQATNIKNCEFDADIYGVGMGKLTNAIDNFLKNEVRLLAVGFQSLIQLFQIKNQQTLQIVDLHILINTQVSLTTQNILINNNNEIFFGGSNRTVSMMSFNQTPKKIVPRSFISTLFRRFSPFKSADNVEKIISEGNKVYCLIKKDKKSMSSSLSKYKYSIQKWINNKVCIPPSYRFIDIYEVTSNQKFVLINSLAENQIAYRMQSNFADSNIGREHDSYQIASIYIENKSKNLGVIFKCGLFAVIKDCNSMSFWKPPDKIPSDLLNIGVDIPSQVAIKNSSVFCSISESKKIIASSGYESLTILNDRVLYLDSYHTYIHKRSYSFGQILQITAKRHHSQLPLLNPSKKWAIFEEKGFDVVTKPEHRDTILVIHSKMSISNEQSFFESLKGKVKLENKIEQLAFYYGFSQFCCYLYELLLDPDYKVRFNREFQQILKSELQLQSQNKNLSNWSVMDNYREGHDDKSYKLNEEIIEKIYELLIRYQSRPVPLPMQMIQKRGQSSEVSDAGWYAVRFIFYRIISSIVDLRPKDFIVKKQQVDYVSSKLRKLLQILNQKQKRAAKAAKLSSMQRMLETNNSKNLDASVTTQYSRNTFKQGPSQLMDEEQGFYRPVSTSTFLLQEKLIDAIPKLLKLIEIFCYIGGDIDKQNNEFPSFASVIYNSQSRKKIKDTILKYFKGEHIKAQLWNQIQYEIPQLQLGKTRKYMKWAENKTKFNPQDIDLQQLSRLFDRQHLPQLQDYFKNAEHRFVQLILAKIKFLNLENQDLISKYRAYANGNYFQRQERKLIDQQRYKIELEIEELKNYLINYVGGKIDLVHLSPQISQMQRHLSQVQQDSIYTTKRVKLDKIVAIIASKAQKQIKQFILDKLTSKKLFDHAKKIQKQENQQSNKSSTINNGTVRKQVNFEKKKIQQMNTQQLLQFINSRQTSNIQCQTTLQELLATAKKN